MTEPENPPFVLTAHLKRIDSVFQFLRLLHLRGVSSKTIRSYSYDLLAFYRYLEEKNLTLDTLSQNHFVDFILSQRKQNAAPRTINRRITVLRSYLNSYQEGWGDKLFHKTCPGFYKGRKNKLIWGRLRLKGRGKSWRVKVPSVLITPLSAAEIKKFLVGLRKYRDQAILYLMLFLGLRSCEVLNLSIDAVDFIDDQIRIRGKGGKERILPLPPLIREALQRYLDYERPDCTHRQAFVVLKGPHRGQPMTSEGLRTLFRYRRKILHLKKANPHKFRHTFCTNMIRQGVSIPIVQKLMGHTNIDITMGYVHMSLEDVSREYHQAMSALQKSWGPHERG